MRMERDQILRKVTVLKRAISELEGIKEKLQKEVESKSMDNRRCLMLLSKIEHPLNRLSRKLNTLFEQGKLYLPLNEKPYWGRNYLPTARKILFSINQYLKQSFVSPSLKKERKQLQKLQYKIAKVINSSSYKPENEVDLVLKSLKYGLSMMTKVWKEEFYDLLVSSLNPSHEEYNEWETRKYVLKACSFLESLMISSKEVIQPLSLPLNRILNSDLAEELQQTKYGSEVLNHIREGNACLRYNLFLPALSSYIHAFEWAMITYLKANNIIDILEEESSGKYYYFAKGKNNLLDKVKKNSDISQKTISIIESMNRAERRWMAHHKSGKILPEEIEGIRARLQTFLKELFS